MQASPLPVLPGLGIVQIAYHTPDIEQAAERFARLFGWGPFFTLYHIPLAEVRYRGALSTMDTSSAFGQAGALMIELIQQHDDTPSAIRDMYRADQFGLHHYACFSHDLQSDLQRYQERGFVAATSGRTTTGFEFAMLDLRREIGVMLELYPQAPMLTALYTMVREASLNWDGKEPVRRLR